MAFMNGLMISVFLLISFFTIGCKNLNLANKQKIIYVLPNCVEKEVSNFIIDSNQGRELNFFILLEQDSFQLYSISIYKYKKDKSKESLDILKWMEKSNRYCYIDTNEVPIYFGTDYIFSSCNFIFTHSWHLINFKYTNSVCKIIYVE
jgi:hypothetical protein